MTPEAREQASGRSSRRLTSQNHGWPKAMEGLTPDERSRWLARFRRFQQFNPERKERSRSVLRDFRLLPRIAAARSIWKCGTSAYAGRRPAPSAWKLEDFRTRFAPNERQLLRLTFPYFLGPEPQPYNKRGQAERLAPPPNRGTVAFRKLTRSETCASIIRCTSDLPIAPDSLLHHLAVFEQKQGRNAPDVVPHGSLPVVIYVQLPDLYFPAVLGRKCVDRGRHLPAGAAPFGPEIHQDRHIRLQHVTVESIVVNVSVLSPAINFPLSY